MGKDRGQPPRHQARSGVPRPAITPVAIAADELRKMTNFYDSLVAATTDAREVLTEVRGLLGDLQRERKRVETIVPMTVGKQVKGKVEDAVAKELETHSDETKAAIGLAEKRIWKRFDDLERLIMGEEDDGHASFMEIFETLGPVLPLIRALLNGEINVRDLQVTFSEDKKPVAALAYPKLKVPIIPAGDDRFA